MVAVSAVLACLVTLSWERAIVIPRRDEDAANLVRLGLLSVVVVGAIVTALAYIFRAEMASILGSDLFDDDWWVTPVTVVLIGLFGIGSSWVVRHQRYGELGWRNALQGLAQAASSVGLGLLGVGSIGLAISPATGRAAGLLGLARQLRPKHLMSGTSSGMWATARTYRRFPLVNTWSRLINTLGLQLPVILIITLYASPAAGLYALTLRVLAAPVGIVVDAVSQYFEGTFSASLREGGSGLAKLIRTVSWRLALVAAIPTAVVLLFGPQLFSVVFGAQWEMAGVYAQILIVAYATQFAISPISRSLVILGHQKTQLVWDVSRAIGTIGAVVVPFALDLEFVYALLCMTTVQVVAYVVLLVLSLRRANRADRIIAAPAVSVNEELK
ncbi:hypothetical protein ASF62_12185 [Leifsonia sp. Leaf325]|nr:hypothetical protein ASF62_12185 [Leifsonia sp. Leaf325]